YFSDSPAACRILLTDASATFPSRLRLEYFSRSASRSKSDSGSAVISLSLRNRLIQPIVAASKGSTMSSSCSGVLILSSRMCSKYSANFRCNPASTCLLAGLLMVPPELKESSVQHTPPPLGGLAVQAISEPVLHIRTPP